MNILAELRSRFSRALEQFTEEPETFADMVRPVQDTRFGDFQANCAMPLGKKAGKPPRDIAAEIVAALETDDLCEQPEVAGPGFINLRLKDDWIAKSINNIASDERLGVPGVSSPRKYVVDFSSPNVAKPMHVGHLRSTVIGDAICRVLRFLGHDVIADNHIGDWGTQFGMIIYGYKNFLDAKALQEDTVAELARLYRLVNQLSEYHAAKAGLPKLEERIAKAKAELKEKESSAEAGEKATKKAIKRLRNQTVGLHEDKKSAEKRIAAVDEDAKLSSLASAHPDIAVRARQETAKLHADDVENRTLWSRFLPECLAAIQQVYNRLDIQFDMTLGESHYQSMLDDVVADLLAKSIAEESDGAICVFIEGNDAPAIVRKADGAFTYATTDLATVKYRVDELKANEILYVVDARQGEHFKLLFAAVERWGYSDATTQHVTFGTVMGKDGKPYKTRSGDIVGLESLIDEAVSRARRIVDDNDENKPGGWELDNPARERIAEIVGIGGIKYADLKHNRDSDYKFDWDKMLSTTGDTATYMQYAYARVCGIFRRGEFDRDTIRNASHEIRIEAPEERALALQLLRFGEAIDEVVADYRPNLLTSYLFETANEFSSFFDKCPVLKAEDDSTRDSRLMLCDLTARVIHTGLDLLGIQTADRM